MRAHYKKAWRHFWIPGAEFEAVQAFQDTIDERASSGNDHMLKAFALVNLGLLFSGKERFYGDESWIVNVAVYAFVTLPRQCWNFFTFCCWKREESEDGRPAALRNDKKSVFLFERAVKDYNFPPARYFYGRALVRGIGCRKDIEQGMLELSIAGSSRIAEAFFELGSIYETGIESHIPRDVATAHDYFEASLEVSKHHHPEEAWSPVLRAVQNLLPTELWHEIADLQSSVLGERFSWMVASQAFLFAAAATMSTRTQPEHFPSLLVLLPILGLVQGVLTFFFVVDFWVRSTQQSMPIFEMLNAKYKAYDAILHQVRSEERRSDTSKKAWERQKRKLEQTKDTIVMRQRLNTLVSVLAAATSGLFIFIWFWLVGVETFLKNEGCGSWIDTTCTGSESKCLFDTADKACPANTPSPSF